MMEGAGGAAIANLRVEDGQRRNLPSDFLYSVLARPNMTLLTGAEVTRLVMSGSKVTGVDLVKDGVVQTVIAAKQVILCAGAINSPKILMLSGIGDPQELGKHSIKTAVALPGVGRNFQGRIYSSSNRLRRSFAAGQDETLYPFVRPTGPAPELR
jgi:choline dehydrogenase